ncbi:CFI-box-CTERM domain-containing protein [Aerosakkonema funiforme]|uniref:CFI-box-CTERM domain-containing protein n=1 Tax=Aerosakkonema funiforme TaxID=1246630 RepID=UPI0035B7505C
MTSPYEDMLENFTLSMDRGDFFQKNKKYQQALQEYADALSSFRLAVSIRENITGSGGRVRYELTTRLKYLFIIATLLGKITACYAGVGQFKESNYILTKQEEIVAILARYERSFTAKDIQNYEDLRQNIDFNKSSLTLQQELIQQGQPVQEFNNFDEISNKIRKSIKEILSLGVCQFMSPDGTSISNSSSSCFIATAAYSTSTHPDLDTFRNFRDEKLLTNPVGKELVSLYYQISPSIAQYVEKRPAIKAFVRQQLERLAKWMRKDLT